MPRSVLAPLALLAALSAQSPPAETANSPRLDESTFEALWTHVRPAPHELEWQRIPWRGVLGDAVREAQAADQPILLWAMNGHPLGCT